MTPAEAAFVLHIWERADLYEELFWRVGRIDGTAGYGAIIEVKLFALCNDWFFWATADCEEIVPADFPLLEATLTDLKAIDCEEYLPTLFASRKRHLRPQKPCYKSMPAEVVPLFDACCTKAQRAKADRDDFQWWVNLAHKVKATRDA